MKTFTEQLDELKSTAQKTVRTHVKDGELHFSERTISFDGGGWDTADYIDEDGIYRLSAEFVCDLADELTGNF